LIPRNVQFIDGSAFASVRLSSIWIESGNANFVIENDFLIDVIHHSLIRNFSISSNVEIPSDIEILGSSCSSCFSSCQSHFSISFESNSQLRRIESFAFSSSALQSIMIPRNVQFIDGSALISVELSSISIESENAYLVIENDLLINVIHHTLVRNFSNSSNIEIPSNIEILGSSCFSCCQSFRSISFESNS
jgi:cytochrome c556